MKATITRTGNLLIQSETEIEDFALEVFCEKHSQAFAETPAMFCFDHSTNFDALIERLNQESAKRQQEIAASAAEKERQDSATARKALEEERRRAGNK